MRRKLGEILLSSGMVAPGDIADALADQSAGEPSRLGDLLVASGKLTPAQLAQALAEQHGVPYTPLPPLATAVLEAVPLDFQRAHRLVPIRVDGEVLSIAMADLADADAVRTLQQTWPQVKVFAAAGDEIDALHSALFGEFPGPPPLELPSVAPPVAAARGSSPSADDLFGSFEFEGEPPAAAPPTASGLFGDLDLEAGGSAPAATPSGLFELSVDDGAGVSAGPSGSFEVPLEGAPGPSGPSGLFELTKSLEASETGDTSGEVLELTTEAEVPAEADASEEPEEELFFEARLSTPSSEVVAPPPVVAPLAAEPIRTEENLAPPELFDAGALPASGPSVLEQLFISPDEPVREPEPPKAPPPKAAPEAKKPAAKPVETKSPQPRPAPEKKPPEPAASPVKPPRASPDAKAPAPKAAADAKKPAAKEPPAAEAKPAGKPIAETKPAAKVPADTKKSADASPAAPRPVEAKPAATKPVAAKPAEPKPAPKKPEAPAADPLALPDWLRGDAAGEPAPVDEGADPWTGELETLAPSKLITGVARALIRKGILTEQDVLEALERKKP